MVGAVEFGSMQLSIVRIRVTERGIVNEPLFFVDLFNRAAGILLNL